MLLPEFITKAVSFLPEGDIVDLNAWMQKGKCEKDTGGKEHFFVGKTRPVPKIRSVMRKKHIKNNAYAFTPEKSVSENDN